MSSLWLRHGPCQEQHLLGGGTGLQEQNQDEPVHHTTNINSVVRTYQFLFTPSLFHHTPTHTAMIATSTPTLKSRPPRKRLHELDRKEGPAIPAKLRLCVYSDYTIVNVIDKSAVISFAVCIFVRQR